MNCDKFSLLWGTGKEILLNNIPQYSQWPAKILNLEEWQAPRRNRKEALREYEVETYQPMLEILEKNSQITSYNDLFVNAFPEHSTQCCIYNGELRSFSHKDAFDLSMLSVAPYIDKYLNAGALLEFGAGTGRNLLWIKQHLNPNLLVFALDYMPSALRVIDILAKRNGLKITTGKCDLLSKKITNLELPRNATIFSMYATCFVHFDYDRWMNALRALSPKYVIHCEPVYNLFDDSLLGGMQKRYVTMNKYNVHYFQKLFSDKKINIHEKKQNCFGTNPFLPFSIVVWSFK